MTRKRIREIADEMGHIEAATWSAIWPVAEECSAILSQLSSVRRRPFLAQVVTELYDEQGGTCALCGSFLNLNQLHVDHRIPFTWGGGNERGNLQLAHPSCNQQKGDSVDLRELIPYLESRYMNL